MTQITYLSNFFTKTKRETPQGETAVNAILLERAGFVAKQMAGVYTLLPLGLKVVEKINAIIRAELNAVGAQEILMPALQPKELWQKTGRWGTANDVMYQFKDNSGKEVGLGWTHEEVVTSIATQYIRSYKDLPRAVYQIQTKFRDEPRAKSGLLRGREFIMKDLYSFHADAADRDEYYEKVKVAYQKIFARVGIEAIVTEASGGAFSKYSHEFQTPAKSGEDVIYICEKCQLGRNQEIIEGSNKKCGECGSELRQTNAIEVGNIFKLGTRFSEALGLKITTQAGKLVPVEMASYGIGPTRVLGTVVEVSHDERGIIWPRSIAPYDCSLITIQNSKVKSQNCNLKIKIDKIIKMFEQSGLEFLLDDREEVSAGEKLADADLIGLPWRVVISPKSLEQGGVELKARSSGKVEYLSAETAAEKICENKK